MCMHWTACLCWRDTKSPSVAIGVFAMITLLLQILVVVAVTTGAENVQSYMNSQNPEGILIKLYIALAGADFFVVVFSIILLVGLEREAGFHRCAVITWLVWIFLYILYESAINIYFFYLALSSNSPTVFTPRLGYLIVPLVYWVCKEIILFCGWSFIASHLCYGDGLKSSDSTLHLVDTTPSGRYSLGTRDAIGPVYYNGGVSQVQVHDNPRTSASHFDVVRPTSSCQVYSANWSRPGGATYLGQRDVYGPVRYM